MPKVNPYDPLNIPNPSDLRRPEVSPKGEGLRKVAEANRAVVEEMHKGDLQKAWMQGEGIGRGIGDLAKTVKSAWDTHQQHVQTLHTQLATAKANELVEDRDFQQGQLDDYYLTNHADTPLYNPAARNADSQNGRVIPPSSAYPKGVNLPGVDQFSTSLRNIPHITPDIIEQAEAKVTADYHNRTTVFNNGNTNLAVGSLQSGIYRQADRISQDAFGTPDNQAGAAYSEVPVPSSSSGAYTFTGDRQ